MTCFRREGELVIKAMKMSGGGRVVVPAEIRRALNVNDGDVVYWELVDGEARLTTKLARLRRSQEMAQKRFPNEPGVSIVSELIADRRREAEQD
jgi:bifunctional DNA-binding transcriptional regulator/antitoxin component of YhaV-PrlF toxin-antitoxin module